MPNLVKAFQPSGVGVWEAQRRAAGAASTATPPVAQASEDVNLLGFVVQVLICTVPATLFLAAGRPSFSGYIFWATLGLSLLRLAASGRRNELIGLLLATAPFINLLRSFAFYNVIIAVYLGGLAVYLAFAPRALWSVCRACPLAGWTTVCVTAYYALSFINTSEYSVNLRCFELAITVFFVLLLGRQPAYLKAALLGLIVSVCLLGVGMVPYLKTQGLGRLGMIGVEGHSLGNPTQLGIPLAFGFLALIVDRGRWVGLASRPTIRWSLLALVLPLLALTSSRASWMVAVSGIFICGLLSGQQRFKMLLAVGIVALAAQVLLMSSFGTIFQKGLTRTFGETRSLRQRTSGRSDQWKVAYYAITRSPARMMFGYGPGRGPKVYAQYSVEVEDVRYGLGKNVALHSLFMQVGVEAGLMGLFLILVFLGTVFINIARHFSGSGVMLPLVCFFGYVFIVITISGSDINSGIFLGIALLGTIRALTRHTRLLPSTRFAGREFPDQIRALNP